MLDTPPPVSDFKKGKNDTNISSLGMNEIILGLSPNDLSIKKNWCLTPALV